MISRRKIATGLGSIGILTGMLMGCASNTANGTVVKVPSLSQAQAWVGVLVTELPAFVQESIATGLISGPAIAKVQESVATFVTLGKQFTSANFTVANATQIATQIGVALTTIAAVVPAAAPYIGLIQLGVVVITGFIAATPMQVPHVPSALTLQSMHKDTLRFHKG